MEVSNTLRYINLTGLVIGLFALRGPIHLCAFVSEERGEGEGGDSQVLSNRLRYINLTDLTVGLVALCGVTVDRCVPVCMCEKKHNDSWVNLKGGGQLVTKVGDGEQMCGMVPGLGSVSGLSSQNPAATSVRCIWTQVYAGVVVICSWKEDFVSMLNRNFARL